MTERENQDLPEVPPEEFERAFVQETHDLLDNRLRLGLSAGMVLYLAFSVLDWFVAKGSWSAFLAIRLGVVGAVGALLLHQRSSAGRRHLIATSFVQVLLGSLGISAMTWLMDGFDSTYFFGNMLVMFLLGLFIPWSVQLTAVMCTAILAGYVGPNLLLHGAQVSALLPVFFLSGTLVLTCWATRASERTRRKDLHLRLRLEQVNAQLEEANDRLAETDEMKTRFFSNVSHELRTPLMLILGPLDSLLQGSYSGDPGALLQAMNTNAHRLLRQVNMILNFSRLERGVQKVNWAPGNVGTVIREQVEGGRPYAAERGMELVLEGVDALPDSYFDGEQIETVFVNLMSNAMKFTDDGGRVTVRAGTEEGLLWWTVEDTGCGIPEKDLAKVFERFHQAEGGRKGKTQGTGLGLSLSRELVRLHGGDITVSSALGEGTTFRVTLPIALPEGADCASVELVDGEAPAPQRKANAATQFADLAGPALVEEAGVAGPEEAPLVLVVEDNTDMRIFVASSLRRTYRVATASDGVEGLEQARRLRPDLIVSDVMMPRLDGFGMVEKLREDREFANTPILLLTARAGSEAVVEGLGRGASDYVNKPFRMAELEARVDAHLRASQAERALDERDSRLVWVGQMTGTIAHDLRGPLTNILGRVELVRMIAEGAGTLAPIEQDLSSVEAAVHRVTDMTQELMEFVRGGDVQLELAEEDAGGFLERVADEMRPSLRDAGVELVVSGIRADDLAVELDAGRMQRVVENLVNNSRDALNAQDGAEDKRIWLRSQREGDRVVLRVSDNGPGIPPEVADRLFQPFATAGKANGTGLGLSIVRNLVAAHGGEIEVDHSPPEGGAAFTISLPACSGPEGNGTPARERHKEPEGGGD
jgi:signal transduction histidine kinase